MWKRRGRNTNINAVRRRNAINNRSDNRPDLSFHAFPKDLKTRKEWELRMRRGDVIHFKSVLSQILLLRAFLSH